MQTLKEIRQILAQAGLKPRKHLGQNFLIDKNLLAKVLELADLTGRETVLEVGPGTGTLTEELLGLAGRVVAVEIDHQLADALARRLGEAENFQLVCGDVLASKHAISPEVLAAIDGPAVMVANLPYNIATPLVAQCLIETRRGVCRFDRLTFTVQKEVAERFAADAGSAYGPVSVLAALMGRRQLGPVLPASAFWPRPKIDSQIVRIDYDEQAAARIADIDVLCDLLRLAFSQRRKQIGSLIRRRDAVGLAGPDVLKAAMERANIDPTDRPERVNPQQFADFANAIKAGA